MKCCSWKGSEQQQGCRNACPQSRSRAFVPSSSRKRNLCHTSPGGCGLSCYLHKCTLERLKHSGKSAFKDTDFWTCTLCQIIDFGCINYLSKPLINPQRTDCALGWTGVQEAGEIWDKIEAPTLSLQPAVWQCIVAQLLISAWLSWLSWSCTVCPCTELKREKAEKRRDKKLNKELNGCVIKPSAFADRALAQLDFPVLSTLCGFGHLVTY